MSEEAVHSEETEVRREPGAWARLWAIRYARVPILICALFFVFALGSAYLFTSILYILLT